MSKKDVSEIIAQQGDLDKGFVKSFRKYLAADMELKDAKARREDAKGPVESYVQEHGVKNRPGTDQRIMVVDGGWKVQWTCRQGRTKVDEEARLAWCQEHAPDAILSKPVVSEEMWTALKATDRVPADALAEIEQEGTSYYLRVWKNGDAVCPKCEGKVKGDDPFCRHCGLKLGDIKKKPAKGNAKKAKAKAKAKKKAA